MTARWDAALDKLLEMYEGWKSPAGKIYAEEFIDSWIEKEPIGTQTGLKNDLPIVKSEERKAAERRIWNNFHYRIETQLWRADPIYVDPDMMTLVESASKEFQPEPLLESDLITPYGFVYLPRPLNFIIAHDHDDYTCDGNCIIDGTISYRYILWGMEYHKFPNGNTMPVLIITIWREPADKDDYLKVDVTYPQLLTVIPWPTDGKTTYPSRGKTIGQWEQVAKPLQTLWRLMSQTITTKTREPASRGTRRRIERSKYLEKNITVIKLRRTHSDSGNHEPRVVEWDHRWLVSGHWRNQWFPSLNAHRQIWISPFIKGPEDKPLEIRKARVFEWVR